MSYEIYTDEDTPYGPRLGIRLTSAEPDRRHVYSTFREAKRVLLDDLAATADDLREQLLRVKYNAQDVRKTRVSEL